MRYDQFIASVRRRGGYPTDGEAEAVTAGVLGLLAYRLTPVAAGDVLASLPHQLRDLMLSARPSAWLNVEQFLQELPGRMPDGSYHAARQNAAAVLSTLADAVPAGQLDQLQRLLPAGFGSLLGAA